MHRYKIAFGTSFQFSEFSDYEICEIVRIKYKIKVRFFHVFHLFEFKTYEKWLILVVVYCGYENIINFWFRRIKLVI